MAIVADINVYPRCIRVVDRTVTEKSGFPLPLENSTTGGHDGPTGWGRSRRF